MKTAADSTNRSSQLLAYLLRHGDDSLILSQRLCEWVARAPRIEDDVALLNVALDHLGHAREFYAAAGALEPDGRDEDDFAYGRTEIEFTNAHLFEVPNGDFGHTIARILLSSTWQVVLYESWVGSPVEALSQFAPRGRREAKYHVEYATTWATRLALGTDESMARLTAGFRSLAPLAGELFVDDEKTHALAADGSIAVPESLLPRWRDTVLAILRPLGVELMIPEVPDVAEGREGRHTEAFSPLLGELQYLRRAFPGGSW